MGDDLTQNEALHHVTPSTASESSNGAQLSSQAQLQNVTASIVITDNVSSAPISAPGSSETDSVTSPSPSPLPHRPTIPGGASSLRVPTSSRPHLHTQATTAVSSIDIHTQTFHDGLRETSSSIRPSASHDHGLSGEISRHLDRSGSETGDTSSLRSYAPTLSAVEDVESLLGEVLNAGHSPAWKMREMQRESETPIEAISEEDKQLEASFVREFDELPDLADDGSNEEALLGQWHSRLKHFIILSAAGKPIYSRHGSFSLISSYIPVIQTIISFYASSSNPLRAFTAGNVRFAILTEGPLHLVAITRLPESTTQLLHQLSSLYTQILSTLTLPVLTSLFTHRPSTDLGGYLSGTTAQLTTLADSFTAGSPSTLLSALECLPLRSSYRDAINAILLKHRPPSLLYGLLVAGDQLGGGRLISVIRPRKHSLHPSDLTLIFNLLFHSTGIKSSGGESWIPICLPGFNTSGYLHMYVSFLPTEIVLPTTTTKSTNSTTPSTPDQGPPNLALILISPSRNAFDSLHQSRTSILQSLTALLPSSSSLSSTRRLLTTTKPTNPALSPTLLTVLQTATILPRPTIPSILPGTPIRHFLYKSRPNVQFVMPAFPASSSSPSSSPTTTTNTTTSPLSRRRLISLYATLHTATHTEKGELKLGVKVLHLAGSGGARGGRCGHGDARTAGGAGDKAGSEARRLATADFTGLVWITPRFELYVLADKTASRAAVAKGAVGVVEWVQREGERVFILGGAVF